jgi:dethiobiotin synthetase
VGEALEYWRSHSEVLLVEGAGGWLTPLDAADHSIADLAVAIGLPVIVVTGAELGAINATLLTVEAVQSRGLEVAGIVFNRVAVEGKRDLVVGSNLVEIPRLARAKVLGVLGEVAVGESVPQEHLEAMRAFAGTLRK